jgi:hypothetical protein
VKGRKHSRTLTVGVKFDQGDSRSFGKERPQYTLALVEVGIKWPPVLKFTFSPIFLYSKQGPQVGHNQAAKPGGGGGGVSRPGGNSSSESALVALVCWWPVFSVVPGAACFLSCPIMDLHSAESNAMCCCLSICHARFLISFFAASHLLVSPATASDAMWRTMRPGHSACVQAARHDIIFRLYVTTSLPSSTTNHCQLLLNRTPFVKPKLKNITKHLGTSDIQSPHTSIISTYHYYLCR